jgi:iron(III) transport system substrate-binding protein
MIFDPKLKEKLNMKKSRIKLAPIALALGAVLALGACASQTPVDQSSDSLTIYSGRNEVLISELLDTFTEETGIQVEVRYGDSAELAAQILEEGDNIRADVYFGQDAGALGALAKEGVTKTLPSDITDLVAAEFKSTDSQWVGVSGRSRMIVVDPAKVDVMPTSYKDLMDPSWKGRIGISPNNASFQAFITAIRVIEGEQAAIDFLEAMKENAVLFEKNSIILQAVEDGVVDAGLINHYYWFELAAQVGAENMKSEIAWFEDGDIGNLINVAGVAVVSDNPNAMVFTKWLLSDTAQQYFVERTREYSLTGVPEVAGLKPLRDIKAPEMDLSELESLAETLELIRKAGLL